MAEQQKTTPHPALTGAAGQPLDSKAEPSMCTSIVEQTNETFTMNCCWQALALDYVGKECLVYCLWHLFCLFVCFQVRFYSKKPLMIDFIGD